MTTAARRALDVPGTNDMVLRAWDHGGDGPVVVLLHGFLDTGRSYDALAAALYNDGGPPLRVLALTWRGHGQSGRIGAGGAYHLLDHLKDLHVAHRFIAAQYGDIAALVAHSMGGNVALMYAAAAPERVTHLLLIDALGPPSEQSAEQPARLARLLTSLNDDKRPFARVVDRTAARARLQKSNPGLSDAGADRMLAGAVVDVPGGVAFNFDAKLRGPVPERHPESHWLALCAAVRARVHLMRAEYGYVPEGEPMTGRLSAMAHATIETVPDAQHHLHVEHPVLIAQRLRTLLTRA